VLYLAGVVGLARQNLRVFISQFENQLSCPTTLSTLTTCEFRMQAKKKASTMCMIGGARPYDRSNDEPS